MSHFFIDMGIYDKLEGKGMILIERVAKKRKKMFENFLIKFSKFFHKIFS